MERGAGAGNVEDAQGKLLQGGAKVRRRQCGDLRGNLPIAQMMSQRQFEGTYDSWFVVCAYDGDAVQRN